MSQRAAPAISFRGSLCLAVALGGAITMSVAAPIDVAVDLDSRNNLGTFNPSLPLTTQPGFSSWELMSALIPHNEQGVSFLLFPWETGGGTPLAGTRTRNLLSPGTGGGGGANDALLTDFVFADVPPSLLNNPRTNPAAGLRLLISGLEPGRYRMTSWHFDSGVVASANRIRIEIGNRMESKDVAIPTFPLGTAPATYLFDVTALGQQKEIDFLVTLEGNRDDPFFLARSRLNGFTLASVPEPASFVMITIVLPALVNRRRREWGQVIFRDLA
jgi:hypothetical protein